MVNRMARDYEDIDFDETGDLNGPDRWDEPSFEDWGLTLDEERETWTGQERDDK